MIDQSKQDQVIMGVSQNSLEKYKFLIDELGRVAVRTDGNLSMKGLSTAGKILAIQINNTTWTKLTTGLTNVNTLAIQNKSGISIALAFEAEVTASKTFNEQWVLEHNDSIEMDVRNDSVSLYAISESGTPTIKLMEIS